MNLTLLLLAAWIACASEQPAKLNIVLVSIDTLRADRVGRKGPNGASITPNLDAFADTAVVFENAISASNESLFSHTALFTGHMPSEFGSMDYRSFSIPSGAPTLARTLQAAGYNTQAAAGGGHLSADFGFDEGFDNYQVGEHFSGFRQTVPMALAQLSEAQTTQEPIFMFVHGYDCHSPYIKPGPAGRAMSPGYDGPFLTLARLPLLYEQIHGTHYAPTFDPARVNRTGFGSFVSADMFDALKAHIEGADPSDLVELTDADKDFLIGSYDSAVLYADMWLGLLLEGIDALGMTDDTIVAVVSDHGEDLLDHGFFNHRSGLSLAAIHVPMLIRIPGTPPARRRDVVSLRDLAATVLGQLGIDHTLGGLDLLNGPPSSDRIVRSEGGQGQRAATRASHHLSIETHQPLSPTPPAIQPKHASLTNLDGQALPWDTPALQPMWDALYSR